VCVGLSLVPKRNYYYLHNIIIHLCASNNIVIALQSTTNSHLTEEQAYKECLDVFKSKPTYNMIKDLPNIALNDSLSACVNDMMVCDFLYLNM
jgi:hypothetical protein